MVTVEIPATRGSVNQGALRIAYIILGHHRPEAIIRLVRRLHASDHGFFIHYNLRSPQAEFQQLKDQLAAFPNVFLLERHKCSWGDSGMIQAALKAIAEMARTHFVYDYAILLTGQDYPIKSDAAFRERLTAAAGGSFMEWAAWPIPDWEKGRAIKRIENFHIHVPFPRWTRPLGWPPSKQHLTIPMKRKIPGGLHAYFGSAFWYLHRSCLKYIHEYVSSHPDFVPFFHHVMVPDECLFQIVLMNSPLAPTISKGTLTYVDWRPPWPGILTMNDLPRMQQGDFLLARKFDPGVDAKVLDQLDELTQMNAQPAAL